MHPQLPKVGPRAPLPTIAGKRRFSAADCPLVPDPFDFRPFIHDSVELDIVTKETSITGMRWSPDGLKLFITGSGSDAVRQWFATAAFDLSTVTFVGEVVFDVSSDTIAPRGLCFNDDGTRLYIGDGIVDQIIQYTLTTGFDLSTATLIGAVFFNVTIAETDIRGVDISVDGAKIYTIGTGSDAVIQYPLSTPFDLSTASTTGRVTFSVNALVPGSTDVRFSPDGTKMYCSGEAAESVTQYTLSTGFDLSTATLDFATRWNVAERGLNPAALDRRPDGSKFYTGSTDADTISEYIKPPP